MHAEARARIGDYSEFKKNLELLGAKEGRRYFFRDHIFIPKSEEWDLNKESVKVRVSDGKATIIYRSALWKNGIKKEKKGFRKETTEEAAFKLMERWGFKEKFSYSRVGYVYELGAQGFVVERIDKIGWLLEVEGEPKDINSLLRKLGLKKLKSSVPRLFETVSIREQKGKGLLYTVLSAVLVSTSFVSSKHLLRYTNAETLSFLWFVIAASAALVIVFSDKKLKIGEVTRSKWRIGLSVGFLNAVGAILWFYSIDLIGPSITAFLLRFATIFTIALGILFLKERLTLLEIAGAAIAIVGAFVVNFSGGNYLLLGSLAALVASLAFALSGFVAKKHIAGIDSVVMTAFRAVFSLPFVALYVFALGRFIMLPIKQVPLLVLGSIVSSIVGTLFFYKAIKRLDISKVVVLRTLDPFIVVFYAFLFFGAMPAANDMLGGLLIVVGIMMTLFRLERVKSVLKMVKEWI